MDRQSLVSATKKLDCFSLDEHDISINNLFHFFELLLWTRSVCMSWLMLSCCLFWCILADLKHVMSVQSLFGCLVSFWNLWFYIFDTSKCCDVAWNFDGAYTLSTSRLPRAILHSTVCGRRIRSKQILGKNFEMRILYMWLQIHNPCKSCVK